MTVFRVSLSQSAQIRNGRGPPRARTDRTEARSEMGALLVALFPQSAGRALTRTYEEHIWRAPLPKLRPSDALPVPVAEIPLPRAATRCFPDLVSRDSNGLVLISYCLARVRATPRTRSAST